MQKEIESVLHGLVDTAFGAINKPQRSIGGKIKKMIAKTLVNKQNIQQQVPGFAHKIMAEVTKPSSYKRLQHIADTALYQMGRKTYDSSVGALLLLVVGLSTTMIEIDAQITSMDFHLLGQNVSFKHQELFFQSKSIMDYC